MQEKFEGGERLKSFPEGEVRRAQDLLRKVREIVEWDLGKMCSTAEEINMVNKAKDAMKDVEALFHVPETKFWTTFSGKDMDESIRQAEEYNKASLPDEALAFSPTDLEKLRVDLEAIDEVVGWDIGASDEMEITILRDGRESLEALKDML